LSDSMEEILAGKEVTNASGIVHDILLYNMDYNRTAFFVQLAECYVRDPDENFSDLIRQTASSFTPVEPEFWDLYDNFLDDRDRKFLTDYGSPAFMVAVRDNVEGLIDQFEDCTDDGNYSTVVGTPAEHLCGLQDNLDRISDDLDLVRDFSEKNGLPIGFVYHTLGDYSRNVRSVVAAPTQQKRQQQREHYIDARRLAFAVLPHLEDIIQNGVDRVFIADRGARPIGKMMQAMSATLDVKLDASVDYFKFTSAKKVTEAYVRTDDFADSYSGDVGAVRKALGDISALRKKEKQYRQSGDEEKMRVARDELAPVLDVMEERHFWIYSMLNSNAKQLQLDAFRSRFGDVKPGEKVYVYDDWVKGGDTKREVEELFAEFGVEIEFRAFLDSRGNTSSDRAKGLSIKIKDAFDEMYAENTGWMDRVFWHNKDIELGVHYGIDLKTQDVEGLFTPHRVESTNILYSLPAPKERFYSTAERMSIAEDIVVNYAVLGPEASLDEVLAVKQKVFDVLERFNSNVENYEATQRQLTGLISREFYARIREGAEYVAGVVEGAGVSRSVLAAHLSGDYVDAPEGLLERVAHKFREDKALCSVGSEVSDLLRCA